MDESIADGQCHTTRSSSIPDEQPVQHASFLVLNIQSMNPDPGSSCSYKYKELGKLVLDSCKKVPIKFIALTETCATLTISLVTTSSVGGLCAEESGPLAHPTYPLLTSFCEGT